MKGTIYRRLYWINFVFLATAIPSAVAHSEVPYLQANEWSLANGFFQRVGNDVRESVEIAPNGIGIPVGHILLIRQSEKYCALKLTSAKLENKGRLLWSAEYESYAYES